MSLTLVPVGVGGCAGGNTVADQARADQANYLPGDGRIETLPPAERAGPVRLSGRLLDGTPWASSQAAGEVLVVNVWGSWCAPCEAEAPQLVAAAERLTSAHDDVAFLGINVGESAATGAAAADRLRLPYPSLSDPDRTSGVALQNKANETPVTLVLDPQGRIAARVVGEVKTPGTLTGLVEDVLREHA